MSEQGERGKTGDTGQQGEHGIQGVQGVQGVAAVGLIGERGRTGDHGQDGKQGRQGVAGSPARSSRTRLLIIYLAIFLIFGLLAARTEVNASHIARNTNRIAVANYQSCKTGAKIIIHFNETQKRLAKLELSEPQPLQSLRSKRAAVYLDGIIPVPNCDSAKPENFSSGP